MPKDFSRRDMLLAVPAGLATVTIGSALARGDEAQGPLSPPLGCFPQQDPELVRRVVGLSHQKLGELRSLVIDRPALANAATDWGFGDWETAIGAASHVGRRENVEFLLEHGARPDLFTFAMLGNLAAVRAAVEATPGVQRIRGPHGITLLAHARSGGEAAADVVRYLESLDDADPRYLDAPLSDDEKISLMGEYRFGDGPNDRLIVGEGAGMGWLTLRRHDGSPQRLFHQGGKVFHPAGAPSVRIAFGGENGRMGRVQVTDGSIVIVGDNGC